MAPNIQIRLEDRQFRLGLEQSRTFHFQARRREMQREDEENDLSSSDSDQSMMSDDEDESIEDDVVLEPIDDEEYRQLCSQVDLNPSDYPARQAYIHAEERKHGRASPPSIQARQEAHQAYPQPEPFWLDWITAVAATLPQSTREESQSRLQAIHSLVQQCQSDYQCKFSIIFSKPKKKETNHRMM